MYIRRAHRRRADETEKGGRADTQKGFFSLTSLRVSGARCIAIPKPHSRSECFTSICLRASAAQRFPRRGMGLICARARKGRGIMAVRLRAPVETDVDHQGLRTRNRSDPREMYKTGMANHMDEQSRKHAQEQRRSIRVHPPFLYNPHSIHPNSSQRRSKDNHASTPRPGYLSSSLLFRRRYTQEVFKCNNQTR